eukprot:6359948-Alexandrium_andersonii.AAC.1
MAAHSRPALWLRMCTRAGTGAAVPNALPARCVPVCQRNAPLLGASYTACARRAQRSHAGICRCARAVVPAHA